MKCHSDHSYITKKIWSNERIRWCNFQIIYGTWGNYLRETVSLDSRNVPAKFFGEDVNLCHSAEAQGLRTSRCLLGTHHHFLSRSSYDLICALQRNAYDPPDWVLVEKIIERIRNFELWSFRRVSFWQILPGTQFQAFLASSQHQRRRNCTPRQTLPW